LEVILEVNSKNATPNANDPGTVLHSFFTERLQLGGAEVDVFVQIVLDATCSIAWAQKT
jgi:hypothetical protein